MISQPELKTKRLLLRPFTLADADTVKLLAGDKAIADVTANIPHPYPDGLAESWISTHAEKWQQGKLAAFAICQKESGLLMGSISLMNLSQQEGELGYWLGVPYWNNGYCTEACLQIVGFGNQTLKLKRIHAHHLSRNPASGKVLLKAGLTYKGASKSTCGYRRQQEPVECYEKFLA